MTHEGGALRIAFVTGEPSSSDDVERRWLAAGAGAFAVFDPRHVSLDLARPPDLVVAAGSDSEAGRILDSIRERAPGVPVAVWSTTRTVRGAVALVRGGAIDYLPATADQTAIERLLSTIRAERIRGSTAASEWHGLVGRSAAMRRLFRQIETVAPTGATILIEGETGTGKEEVARIIHRLSPRSAKPFIVCNCSAIVASLAESELFGHEKGAFTGARRAKAGLFEAARGGTLFFDQVQELSLALQPKLLRVLENREFTRLGATRATATDVRVIAAASRGLADEVREKRFREDLYYRLNTATLAIPPLRERREDIPLLVERFLADFASRLDRPTRLIARDALNRLMALPWEGNVRELRNVIERAAAVSRRRVLTARELRPPRRARSRAPSEPPSLTDSELLSLDELERNQIRHVLESTGGNRVRACKLLGLSRSTLFRRLKELGIPEEHGSGSHGSGSIDG